MAALEFDYLDFSESEPDDSLHPQDFEELCANFEYAKIAAQNIWPRWDNRDYDFEQSLSDLAAEWPAFHDALEEDRTAPQVLALYESLLASSQDRLRSVRDQEGLYYQVGQFVHRQQDRVYALAESNDPLIAAPATRLLFLGAHDFANQHDVQRLLRLAPAVRQDIIAAEHPNRLLARGVVMGLSDAVLWSGNDLSGQDIGKALEVVDAFADHPKTASINESVRRHLITRLLTNVGVPPEKEKVAEYLSHPGYLTAAVLTERHFRQIDFDSASDAEMTDWRASLADLHQRSQAEGVEKIFLHHLGKEARYANLATNMAMQRIGETVLAHLSVNGSTLQTGWELARGDGNSTHYSSERYAQMNVERIAKIEEAEPGATEYLMREYGIRSFNRLPAYIWINQYRNRDDSSRPKEVVLMARSDHNAALSIGSIQTTTTELYTHAQKNGSDVVVFECDTVSDVLRGMFKIRHQYNQHISGLYAVAHGNQSGMSFGDSYTGVFLTSLLQGYDSTGQTAKRIQSLFLPKAEGVLCSCSTGLPDGPAEALADYLKIPMTGPSGTTGIDALNPRATGNGTAFQPLYENARSVRYTA